MSAARFRRSAGGVSSLGLHLVWCPKYRRRLLGGRVTVRLNDLLEEIATEHDWQIVGTAPQGQRPDHVHINVAVRPTDSPAEVARRFKGRTSCVLRAELPWLARLSVLWSKSYFAASVGYVSESTAAPFRRVRAGEAPGYPRFKAAHRFDTVEWPCDCDGCRWKPEVRGVHLQGVGDVKVSAHRKIEGRLKTIQFAREGRRWMLVLS